jgi:probable HAF family extracellular repeat protein
MNTRKTVVCFFALTLVMTAASAMAQQALTITFANVKAPGATQTDSYAVNNAGTIAGDYIDSKAVQHGMILTKSKVLTKFDGPAGSTLIAAYGINTANAVVGWYNSSTGVNTAFMFAKGKFAPVAPPGAASTQANGINDKGFIVGSFTDSKGVRHGFYWDTKKYHTVNAPKAVSTTVWSINNGGLMAVFTLTAAGVAQDAYTYNGTKFTKVDVPGAAGSVIHAINNKGDIVYTIFDSANNRHGVLFHAGKYTQFDDPKGVNSTRADGLNDTLLMVGRYSPTATTNAGFSAQAK